MKRGKHKCEGDISHLSLLLSCPLFGNMYIGNMLQKDLQLKKLSFENLRHLKTCVHNGLFYRTFFCDHFQYT